VNLVLSAVCGGNEENTKKKKIKIEKKDGGKECNAFCFGV